MRQGFGEPDAFCFEDVSIPHCNNIHRHGTLQILGNAPRNADRTLHTKAPSREQHHRGATLGMALRVADRLFSTCLSSQWTSSPAPRPTDEKQSSSTLFHVRRHLERRAPQQKDPSLAPSTIGPSSPVNEPGALHPATARRRRPAVAGKRPQTEPLKRHVGCRW